MPVFRTAVRFLQMIEQHDKLSDLLFIKKRQIVLADRPVEKASGQIRFMAGKRLKKELLQIYGNPLAVYKRQSKNSYSSAFSRRLCRSRSPCRPPFPSPPDLALPCGAAPCKDSCKGRYKLSLIHI